MQCYFHQNLSRLFFLFGELENNGKNPEVQQHAVLVRPVGLNIGATPRARRVFLAGQSGEKPGGPLLQPGLLAASGVPEDSREEEQPLEAAIPGAKTCHPARPPERFSFRM